MPIDYCTQRRKERKEGYIRNESDPVRQVDSV
jgi:hypothetical protein